MKLSISLSTLLLVLPALVSATSMPVHARGLSGEIYMPRNHARQFGRQRQGGFRQGGNKNNKNTVSSSVAAPTAAGASNGRASTESCPAPTTVTVTAGGSAATSSAAPASATVVNNQNGGGGKGGGQNKGNNNNQNAATSSTSAGAPNGTVAANNGNNNGGGQNGGNNNNNGNNNGGGQNGGNNNNNGDPNTSLTLLANLVAPGLAQDGQAVPVAGQVPSLTSTNNFINFCAGKTITNGKQITGGSCNPIPMGDIIPKAKMPTCKFASPANQDVIPANTPFTIRMNIQNMQAGVFTNAQKTYYMAPQQLNNQGVLIGHSHFVIQKMGAFNDPAILDPATFAFFKGINTAAVNGQLTADVAAGLPAGNYRLASINTDSNHAPAVAAVAQHGWLDDIVYFTCQ